MLLAVLALEPFPSHTSTAATQTPAGSIAGSVRDGESGRALGFVIITSGSRHASTDSLGRFALTAMPSGEAQIHVRRLGFKAFDTIVVVARSGQTRLDIQLQLTISERDIRASEAKNVAAGATDSSALGLLRRASLDSPLTFGAFGARFVSAMARTRSVDSNTVLSPVSVAFALSIPLLGASGTTADEIRTALGVSNMDGTTLRQRTANAMSAGSGRRDVQLEIANSIWVDTTVRLASAFADAVAAYHASVRSLPLGAPSTVDAVNAWADTVTHGKITKVLREPLPDTARLFIANAVYFKGKWLDEFDKSQTRQREFKLPSGNTIQVDGMERTGNVGYRHGDGYKVIRLPYRGGRFTMYVVLPDSETPVGAVEQNFAEHGWPTSLVQRDFREVHLVIPRLHVNASYDLRPVLQSLGIHSAFDCDVAEFSGIAIERGRKHSVPLCIGEATQTVYLDVDEEGTEAVAVSGLFMLTVTSAPPPPIEFIVDRPFLFLLRDEQTGADLFAGSIRHP
jgi:serpin B